LDRPDPRIEQRVDVTLELRARVPTHHHDHLADPAIEKRPNGVVEERLAVYRCQELPSAEPLRRSGGGDHGDRAHAQAGRRERSARSVKTRAARLRCEIVPDVLSIGRAALCTASAAATIASSSRRLPRNATAAASTSIGREASAVIATRASPTTPPSQRTAAATPAIGKSKELRSRSLRYALRHPSASGSVISVKTSSALMSMGRIPSSR